MDRSRPEERIDSHEPQVPGSTSVGWHDSTRKDGDRNHPILVTSTQSECLTSTSPKVSNFRRSRFGEVDGYKELRQIGSGGFGNCFLLERKTDKALRVCKVQRREYCHKLDDFEDEPVEASILRDILPPHDRILRLHEIIVQTHTVQLYYDFYDGGDLNQLIQSYRDQSQQIPEEFLWHAYQQISEALAYIHYGYDRRTMGPLPSDWTSIIHGDVKDRNIFLGPPDRFSTEPLARVYPSLVLGDFGLADLQPSRRWGTVMWQPPELPMLSKKSDVWGAGAVIHALAHKGMPPILELSDDASDQTYDEWCENPESRQATPLVPTYSHDLQDCVLSALDMDPMRRFNSYQLHSKVTAVYNLQIAPYLESVAPLLPPAARKNSDEDSVTLKIKDGDLVSEQEMAAKDAIEAKKSFKHGRAIWPYETSARPVIAVTADYPGPNLSSTASLSALKAEKRGIIEEAKREDNAAKLVVEQALMLAGREDKFVRPEGWLSIRETAGLPSDSLLPLVPTKTIDLTLSRPPAVNEPCTTRNDGRVYEQALSAFGLHAVEAVVCDGMICDDDGADDCKYRIAVEAGIVRTDAYDRQLDIAVRCAVDGVPEFGIDPSEWFIEPGQGMYVFGTGAQASPQPVKHEAGSNAFPVDSTGWFINPGSGLYVFGATSDDAIVVRSGTCPEEEGLGAGTF